MNITTKLNENDSIHINILYINEVIKRKFVRRQIECTARHSIKSLVLII